MDTYNEPGTQINTVATVEGGRIGCIFLNFFFKFMRPRPSRGTLAAVSIGYCKAGTGVGGCDWLEKGARERGGGGSQSLHKSLTHLSWLLVLYLAAGDTR